MGRRSQSLVNTKSRSGIDVFLGIFNSKTADIGRFLAASTIFYFHVGLFLSLPYSQWGEQAVEYFVILAGISYVAFSRSKPAGPAQYFNYSLKRAASQFPAFFIVNLGLYVASYLHSSLLGRPYRFTEFLASATGISMYLDWKYMSTVMWFMPFIIQVYLLLPLLDWVAQRVHPVVLMLCAVGISFLIAQPTPPFIHAGTEAMMYRKNWSPLFRLPEVCAGVILGRIVLTRQGLWPGVGAVAVYGLFSWLTTHVLPTLDPQNLYYMPWSGFWVPGLLFGISALAGLFLRDGKAALLRVLNPAAFAFYLIQAAPMAALTHRFSGNAVVWIFYFVLCWVAAAAIAFLPARAMRILRGRTPP
jgi:peptidoglycan/LPS O-acetylase OafA/YrhL